MSITNISDIDESNKNQKQINPAKSANSIMMVRSSKRIKKDYRNISIVSKYERSAELSSSRSSHKLKKRFSTKENTLNVIPLSTQILQRVEKDILPPKLLEFLNKQTPLTLRTVQKLSLPLPNQEEYQKAITSLQTMVLNQEMEVNRLKESPKKKRSPSNIKPNSNPSLSTSLNANQVDKHNLNYSINSQFIKNELKKEKHIRLITPLCSQSTQRTSISCQNILITPTNEQKQQSVVSIKVESDNSIKNESHQSLTSQSTPPPDKQAQPSLKSNPSIELLQLIKKQSKAKQVSSSHLKTPEKVTKSCFDTASNTPNTSQMMGCSGLSALYDNESKSINHPYQFLNNQSIIDNSSNIENIMDSTSAHTYFPRNLSNQDTNSCISQYKEQLCIPLRAPLHQIQVHSHNMGGQSSFHVLYHSNAPHYSHRIENSFQNDNYLQHHQQEYFPQSIYQVEDLNNNRILNHPYLNQIPMECDQQAFTTHGEYEMKEQINRHGESETMFTSPSYYPTTSSNRKRDYIFEDIEEVDACEDSFSELQRRQFHENGMPFDHYQHDNFHKHQIDFQ